MRAVYTAGVGFTHGSASNLIQIDYPAFVRTTLTQAVVTLSEPVISGEYLQVCETGDSTVCYNGGGNGTTLSRYIVPQAAMSSIFIGVVNGPSTVVNWVGNTQTTGPNPSLFYEQNWRDTTSCIGTGNATQNYPGEARWQWMQYTMNELKSLFP